MAQQTFEDGEGTRITAARYNDGVWVAVTIVVQETDRSSREEWQGMHLTPQQARELALVLIDEAHKCDGERVMPDMAKMAGYADAGLLGSETLFRLQMGPDLRLTKGPDGRWIVVRPDADVRPALDPAVRQEVKPGFDKKAYQREYMRAKRAKERGD